MIYFDGIDIRNVAKVKIEDIRVSGIEFSPVARNRAIAQGAVFVRNRPVSRTVTVTFAILEQSIGNRQASLMAINHWAKSDQEYELEVVGHPDHYLKAVCTQKPDPSTRQWWESKLRLVFTCISDPYWIDKVPSSFSCGSPFTVLGDYEPIMQIERNVASDVSDQSYTMDGKTMTFTTIPEGDLVIDLNNQTAEVDGESIMEYYSPASKFLVPALGGHTVTGTGTVKFRQRWA